MSCSFYGFAVVIAPCAAEPTSVAYFANAPEVQFGSGFLHDSFLFANKMMAKGDPVKLPYEEDMEE